MIMLTLRAQLGNQMYQYAALRALCEARGWGLAWRGQALPPVERVKALLGLRPGAKPIMLAKYFALGGDGAFTRRIKRLAWNLTPAEHKIYLPPRIEALPGVMIEGCHPDFPELSDGDEVAGWFQSESFFRSRRSDVVKWFQLKQAYADRLAEEESKLPVPSEKRCCIHVRRGDYLASDAGFADGAQGWALPYTYYEQAISRLPSDLFFVIISDDPDFAERTFSSLPNKRVSRNTPACVDMFLLTRCRYNIIANSSFSWWGAWLNDLAGKVVLAPRYFVGWNKGVWNPSHVAVPEWTWIDVPAQAA